MLISDPGFGSGSGIRDGKNLDPGSGIWDENNLDSGSGIRKKHPGPATMEISSSNFLGLQELNKNQTLCGKAFWDETKSFLQSKAAAVALKERKTTYELDFLSPTRQPTPSPNYVPRSKTPTAAYLPKI
jgi:hypothetical protein